MTDAMQKHRSRCKRWDDNRVAAKVITTDAVLQKQIREHKWQTLYHLRDCKVWGVYWEEMFKRNRARRMVEDRKASVKRHSSRPRYRKFASRRQRRRLV